MARPAKITNCDGCGDFGKTRKTKGLDQHLCFDCAKENQDLNQSPRKQLVPITDPEEARAMYELGRSNGRSTGKLPDYDTLKAEFESDCISFTEISNRYQLTRERIRQIYRRFFSAQIPRRPDGRTRQKICTLKRRALKKVTKREQRLSNHPVCLVLKSAAEPLDLQVQATSFGQGRGLIVSIGGKYCAVYSCNSPHQFVPTGKLYWSFHWGRSVLKRSEFVICVILDNEESRFFIIPTHKLPSKFMETKGMVTAYIPQGGADPKGRGQRKDSFDILIYENAWHLLKSSEDKKTAPAVPVLPVSSSPVS